MGQQTISPQAIRQQVHGAWAAVAPAWADNTAYVDARAADLTAAMIDRTGPQPGERVLELACGAGGPGLNAATLVGPSGQVVLSDVVPAMTRAAAARAAERGLDNVHARVLDQEAIDEPDDSFDIIYNREGLMFSLEPDRAAAEMARTLRPGGRIAVSVWGSRASNPWLGLVADAVSEVVGHPVPPAHIPGPFSLSQEGRLAAVLTSGGFLDVSEQALSLPVRAPSFEQWWTRTQRIAGPLARVLGGLSDEAKTAVTEQLRLDLAPYTTSDGIQLPGLCLLAVAHMAT